MLTLTPYSIEFSYSDGERFGYLPELSAWYKRRGIVPSVGDRIGIKGLLLAEGPSEKSGIHKVYGIASVQHVFYDIEIDTVSIGLTRLDE